MRGALCTSFVQQKINPVWDQSFQNYRPPEKSNLSYLKCVALVKPTSENIRLLAREVASPRYGSYFIFFTNRVKRADLKSLAEADGNEVVSDLKEIPSDFLVFESHVFTTKLPAEMPFPVKNLQWNKENSALQRYGLLSNYKYFQCIPSYVFFCKYR